MLTVKQAYLNLLSYHVCSKLNIFPIKVHAKAGKISLERSKLRWTIWRIWFYLLALRLVYSLIILMRLLLNRTEFDPHEFPVQIVTFIGYITGATGFYYFFLKYPEVTVAIFNKLLHKRGKVVFRESRRLGFDYINNFYVL